MINLEDIPQLLYRGKLTEREKQPGLRRPCEPITGEANAAVTMRWVR